MCSLKSESDPTGEQWWQTVAVPTIRNHFGPEVYGNFLHTLRLVRSVPGELCLTVATNFLAHWIRENYQRRLADALGVPESSLSINSREVPNARPNAPVQFPRLTTPRPKVRLPSVYPSLVMASRPPVIEGRLTEARGQAEEVVPNPAVAVGASRFPVDDKPSSLGEGQAAGKPPITIGDIKEEVAKHFEIPVSDLLSTSRRVEIIWHRQVAVYLARILTQHSNSLIGRCLGGFDESTIIYHLNRFTRRLESDATLWVEVSKIEEKLRSRFAIPAK